MRRKDREQPREFALSVIDQSDYAVLAAVGENGAPYCVPLTLAREGDSLYFHCAPAGQKLDVLRANPKVCVSFVCEAVTNELTYSVKYASAIATGSAHIIEDEGRSSSRCGFYARGTRRPIRTACRSISISTFTAPPSCGSIWRV